MYKENVAQPNNLPSKIYVSLHFDTDMRPTCHNQDFF